VVQTLCLAVPIAIAVAMSDIFEGVLARLACAKASLENVKPERRHKVSSLQSAAVVEQVKSMKSQKVFTSERKAHVMDLVLQTKFLPEHSDAILADLDDSPSLFRARRKGQDFSSWTSYCSEQEWGAILSDQNDDACVVNMVVDIVLVRLQCRNASEETKKSIADATMTKSCKSLADVYTIPSWRKTSIKDAVHRRFEARKRKTAQPSSYLECLPSDPEELRRTNLEFFMLVSPPSGFAKCPLDLAILGAVAGSYNTRGGGSRGQNTTALSLAPRNCLQSQAQMDTGMGANPMLMMQMMQMCLRAVGGAGAGGGGGVNECPLTFAQGPNRKRSLSALAEDGAEEALAARQLARQRLGLPGINRAPSQGQSVTPPQPDAGLTLTFPGPAERSAAAEDEAAPAPAALPAAVPAPAAAEAEASSIVAVPAAAAKAMPASSIAAAEKPDAESKLRAERETAKVEAKSLLEAIMNKAAQAKADAKRQRLTGKQAAKLPADAAPATPATKAPKTPLKTATPDATTKKTAAAPKPVVAKGAGGCDPHSLWKFELPPGCTLTGTPTYSHERSRNQFQCRSGYKGPRGVNMSIQYGGASGLTEKQAADKASAWVELAKKKFAAR
jgi:hypothetical protein